MKKETEVIFNHNFCLLLFLLNLRKFNFLLLLWSAACPSFLREVGFFAYELDVGIVDELAPVVLTSALETGGSTLRTASSFTVVATL